MVLIDKKILAGGIAMLAVGIALLLYLSSTMPMGTVEMTDEQIEALLLAEQQNKEYSLLATMLTGVGFLLTLVSFGARRKKKGGAAKSLEKKPPA
jgi:hypothetical protein